MSFVLEDLVVDRVDLVDEGANSAAFIELFKRKEQDKMDVTEILSKMKPEHAEVLQAALKQNDEELAKAKADLEAAVSERDEAKQNLSKALEDLNTANEDLENTKSELETLKSCGEQKEEETEKKDFDETETMKSMPAEVREMFDRLNAQKEAAETELRKAKEAEQDAIALAKAKELKSIPVEQDKLVGIIKSASTEMLDLLTVVNATIESAVLGEVGKSASGTANGNAWDKIEAKAEELAKAKSLTHAKAVSEVIKENPDLYKEYLQGGNN